MRDGVCRTATPCPPLLAPASLESFTGPLAAGLQARVEPRSAAGLRAVPRRTPAACMQSRVASALLPASLLCKFHGTTESARACRRSWLLPGRVCLPRATLPAYTYLRRAKQTDASSRHRHRLRRDTLSAAFHLVCVFAVCSLFAALNGPTRTDSATAILSTLSSLSAAFHFAQCSNLSQKCIRPPFASQFGAYVSLHDHPPIPALSPQPWRAVCPAEKHTQGVLHLFCQGPAMDASGDDLKVTSPAI